MAINAEAPPPTPIEQPPIAHGPTMMDPEVARQRLLAEDASIAALQFQGLSREQLLERMARIHEYGRTGVVLAGVMRESTPGLPVEQLGEEAAKLDYFGRTEAEAGRTYRGPQVAEALDTQLLSRITREAEAAVSQQAQALGRSLTGAERRAIENAVWDQIDSRFEQARAETLERLPDTPLLSFPAMPEEEPRRREPLALSPPPPLPPPGRHSSTENFQRHHGRFYPGDFKRPADWPPNRTRGSRSRTSDFKRPPESTDLFRLDPSATGEAPTEEMNAESLPPTQEMETPYAFPNEKHIYYEPSSAPKESVQEFASGRFDVPKQLVTIVAQPGAELDTDRHQHTSNLDERQMIITDTDNNQYFISGRLELDLKDLYKNGPVEGQNWRSVGSLGILNIGQPMRRADGTMTQRPIKRVEFVSGVAATKNDLGAYTARQGQNPFTKQEARLKAAFAAINHRTQRATREQATGAHAGSQRRRGRGPRRPRTAPESDSDDDEESEERPIVSDVTWKAVFAAMFGLDNRASSAKTPPSSGDSRSSRAWEAPRQPAAREEPDPYDVLKVDRDATREEIRAIYRRRANENHPDIGGDEEEFKKFGAAYEVLGDPKKRAYYDQHGSMDGYGETT
jgi:hypothetical protein